MKVSTHEPGTEMLLYSYVFGVRMIFSIARIVDPRFRKTLDSFDAVYQFRSGSAIVQLIFSNGAIRTRYGAGESADCEINFIDLRGALTHLLKRPNDGLTLLLENKVSQDGNSYYFLKFGYLCGLIERNIRDLSDKTGIIRRATNLLVLGVAASSRDVGAHPCVRPFGQTQGSAPTTNIAAGSRSYGQTPKKSKPINLSHNRNH